MHAAIIAREATRLRSPQAAVKLEDYLLIHPDKRAAGHVLAFVESLKIMAGGKPRKTPRKRPRSGSVKASQVQPAKRKRGR